MAEMGEINPLQNIHPRTQLSESESLRRFHATLSDESVYLRYFASHPHLSAVEVHRFTHVDGAARVALVVLDGERIVAVGRYDRAGDRPEAEVAFVVTDEYQNRGLATILLEMLARVALAHRIEIFIADTLHSNMRMRRVFARSGYDVHSRIEDGVVRVEFRIDQPPSVIAEP
jgi:GNAT superfamily N-acetyltransferase